MLKRILSTGLGMLLLAGCSAPKEITAPDYFPFEAGSFSDFKVEKTSYRAGSEEQVQVTTLRRSISGPVASSDGRNIFSIQYTRQNQHGDWVQDSASAAWRTIDKFFEQENGKPVIKAVFPLYENLKWNCQAYSNAPESFAVVKSVGKPYSNGQAAFDQTATIIRQNDSTLLSKKQYIEMYAANVGLIRRERIYLQYCFEADCRGKGVIESGWKEIITLEKTGKQ